MMTSPSMMWVSMLGLTTALGVVNPFSPLTPTPAAEAAVDGIVGGGGRLVVPVAFLVGLLGPVVTVDADEATTPVDVGGTGAIEVFTAISGAEAVKMGIEGTTPGAGIMGWRVGGLL